MLSFIPPLVLLLAAPSLLTSQEPQVGGRRRPRDQDSVTVLLSEGCATQGDSSDYVTGKEVRLAAGSPLVLTHKIKLVPSAPGSGSCGCEADFAALRERVERLEREASALREKCGGADGGCCTSKESKGAACSIKSEDRCPNDCSDQGRCVEAKCVCFPGHSGPDCSRTDCPADCSGRGRCVSGRCVCDPDFAGPSCSEHTCPGDCSGRGKCVSGKCVCGAGFAGPDCSAKSCPGNCSSRGRCVKGRCACRRGFSGPDCSQCDEGKTGPNCDAVMSGVSQLSTRDITETSATLVWTPPAVQYDRYHVTFTSQKESEQQVTAQVDGGLATFTQTGLAAGQDYTVTVSGEIGGRRGAESSAEFTTLIPRPTNLQVVKTTTTSAVVQWEKPQGEIDRYRLTVAPRDGAEKNREMTVAADRDSASILQLDAGRLYDITLVAEKDASRSEPASTQAVPAILSKGSTAALTVQATLAPGQDGPTSPDPPMGRETEDDPRSVDSVGGADREPSASVIGRTKPLVSRSMTGDGSNIRLSERRALSKKPNLPGRFNAARFVPNGRKLGSRTLTKPLPGDRMRAPIAPKRPQPPVGDQATASTGADDRNPAVMSGPGSEPSSKLSQQPGQETISESTGTFQTQEKRCMNKMKVTHSRLGLRGRGSGCREDGTVEESTSQLGPDRGSSEADGSPPYRERDPDYSPDPLHKLLTDTFDSLNITTFSVHLAKPSSFSVDAETVKKQILSGLMPLSSFSSSSTPSKSKSVHPSPPRPSAAPSPPPSALSASFSQGSLSSTMKPSLKSLDPTSAASSPRPLSSSNAVRSESDGPSEDDDGRSTTAASQIHRTLLLSRRRDALQLRQASPKRGRHQPVRFGTIQSKSPANRTLHLLRPKVIPGRETEAGLTSANELPASPSLSASKDRNAPEQTQKNTVEEPRQVPVRRLPPKTGYMRPNMGLHNQSRPNRPSRPVNSRAETPGQQVSSTDLPAMLSPPANLEPVKQEEADGTKLSMTNTSSELNQTLRRYGKPASRAGYPHQLQRQGGRSTNKTRLNLSQHLQRLRNKPSTKANELPVTSESASSRLGSDSIPEIRAEQVVPGSAQDVGIRQLGDKDTTIRPQTTQSKPDKSSSPHANSDLRPARGHVSEDTRHADQHRPTIKQSSSNSRAATFPEKQSPTRGLAAQQHRPLRHYQKPDRPTRGQFDARQQTPVRRPGVSSAGGVREPLDYVGVTNRSSDGFTLVWDSPEGKYRNFTVSTKEAVKLQDARDDSRLPLTAPTSIPRWTSSTTSEKTRTEVLPGSARSLQFEDLFPQTDYTVTLLGTSPGLLSRLHKLVISTGPEPPSNVVFSKVTENSLTVSWTKPKSPVNAFKVSYTHSQDGDPLSVSVDSEDSSLNLSQLSPGSSYQVSVVSLLGLDESDPITEAVTTLPDPPTDVQAVNITDSKALLLWRPALASVDQYAIVYGSGTGSEVRISVSGNAAEQQLSGLQGSTTYTVTVTSQQGSAESSPATASFSTASGPGREEDAPRNLQANNVTPRAALLSWKPPSKPVDSYRMTYQAEGQEVKEVAVEASVAEYDLTGLHPGSKYAVQLQAERGGQYLAAISTEFTTGRLKFPFPSDCSQQLLNGIRKSGTAEIFPQGKLGKPLTVSCDMETDGGGWTVFQRRKDGSVNFFRGWKDYVKGFGDVDGEFWLGLDSLHNLTAMSRMSLRVDLRDRNESAFARYATFDVAKKTYRLTVGGYSGTAGDSLSYHNNRMFSTRDRDPLQFITRCAMSYRGGWWYKNCHEANLNGLYGVNVKHQGVIWTSWRGQDFSIPFTEMKMRPAAFSPPSRA